MTKVFALCVSVALVATGLAMPAAAQDGATAPRSIEGIPVPKPSELGDFATRAPEIFGYGAFAWAGGAVVLLLASLIGFGRR